MTKSHLFRGRNRSTSSHSSRRGGHGHSTTTTTTIPNYRSSNNYYRNNRQMVAPVQNRQPISNPNYIRRNYNPNAFYNNPYQTPQYISYPQRFYQRGQRYNIR
ncbi:hypothetical protein I4U23_022883 [Adineta vaga]|nr:hypothetical protein I4U23_022883 [Adineta vaga]